MIIGKNHTLPLLVCLTGLASVGCINLAGTGGQPPDADTSDADTTDADLTIIATATSMLIGNSVGGEATFEEREAGVTGIVKVDRANENDPEFRGVRIMTGTSCEPGSEGTVWDLGDLGDIQLLENPAGQPKICDDHVRCGELTVDLSDWSIDTDASNDIDGQALVVYTGPGDSGSIHSCGIIAGLRVTASE